MTMRLVDNDASVIPVTNLQDGEVAVVVSGRCKDDPYVGRIVQRYKERLITLGEQSGASFPDMFSRTNHKSSIMCRRLEPGDIIAVE